MIFIDIILVTTAIVLIAEVNDKLTSYVERSKK